MSDTLYSRDIVYPDDPEHRFWDPWWFCQMTAVESRAGPLVPYHLWPHQFKVRDALLDAYAAHKWIVRVKSRRIGDTTFWATIAYQHAAYREGCHSAFLSNKRDNTRVAMRTARMVHRHLPDEVRSRADARLKRSMEFLDVGGVLTVHSVKDDEPLRGEGVHFLMPDELSAWARDGVDDKWAAARSAVPEEGGMIVALGTPKYDGDPLHQVWKEAEAPGSKWIQSFTAWTEVLEYRREPPAGWTESAKVKEYREQFDITDSQACWLEIEGLPKCAGNIELFRAEYPISISDAWSLKSDSMFDAAALTRHLRAQGLEDVPAEAEEMIVLAQPQDRRRYAVICDPAGSWSKRDYFGGIVLDLWDYTDVVEFRLHGEAWAVATMLVRLSREYGNGNIYVERNGVGEAVVSHLDVQGWPYLYRDENGTPGWWSSARSRAEALGHLQAHIADGSYTPRTARGIRQMLQYAGGWGSRRDEQGGHFDLVAARAIGAWAWVREGGHSNRPPDPRRVAEINYRRLLRRSFGSPAGEGRVTPWGLHR